MGFLTYIFIRKKKVTPKPVQISVEPILTDEEKEAKRKRNVKKLFESIENGNTVRMNIDGHSMLYTRRKNEQNNN